MSTHSAVAMVAVMVYPIRSGAGSWAVVVLSPGHEASDDPKNCNCLFVEARATAGPKEHDYREEPLTPVGKLDRKHPCGVRSTLIAVG